VEGRGRIDLLTQLTNRRAGASLLGRIRPARPTSPREQARALQQGSDVNQLASSGNNAPPTKLNPTQRPGRQSLLDRARSRPRRPFLPTKPTRAPFTPRRPSPRKSSPRASSSNRRPSAAAATDNLENSLRGGECDALKTENELLKQLIASVTSQKPRCCLSQTFSIDLQLAGWAKRVQNLVNRYFPIQIHWCWLTMFWGLFRRVSIELSGTLPQQILCELVNVHGFLN